MAALLVTLTTPALGADGLVSTTEAGLGMATGSLSYGFELTGYDSRVGQRVTAESDLEWPLSASIVQGAWRLSLPAGQGSHYGVRLSMLSSLDDPRGVFKDTDWVAPAGSPDLRARFSYIESDVSGRWLLADMGLWLGCDRGGRGHEALALLVGYRHEVLSLLASNMRGWQWAYRRRVPMVVGGGLPALDLRSQLFLPYIGGRWQDATGSGLLTTSIELRASLAFARVSDDHVQRHKLLEGRSLGWALSARSEPRVRFAGIWSGGLDAEWQLVRAEWGTLSQHYYADDPSLNGDQTGQDIRSPSFYGRSLRYTAVLVVGAEMR